MNTSSLYGLVVSLESKQKYATNANPDFCMNLHVHIRVGVHGSLSFLTSRTPKRWMTLVHSLIPLLPSLPGRFPIVGLVASFGSSVDILSKLTWQSVRRVPFYISGRYSALLLFHDLNRNDNHKSNYGIHIHLRNLAVPPCVVLYEYPHNKCLCIPCARIIEMQYTMFCAENPAVEGRRGAQH